MDLLLAAGLALVSVTALFSDAPASGVALEGEAVRPADLLGLAVVLGQSLPLLLRRRAPHLCFLGIGAAALLDLAVHAEPNPSDYGIYFALYALGAYASWTFALRWAAATVFFAVRFVAIVTVVTVGVPFGEIVRTEPWTLLTEPALVYATEIAVWLALGEMRRRLGRDADSLRLRAARAENRRLEVELAAVEQRRRLGRDLHDAVGHHVTLMILQADALRSEDREEGRRSALAAIGDTGRRALDELRELVGVLELTGPQERAPLPRLDDLEALLAPVRDAGLDVDVEVQGAPRPLPAGVDLSLCRVLQEALTNTLRHADADCAQVTIRYEPTRIAVDVRDDGRGVRALDALHGGSGLHGLRERVRLFDGGLEAGNLPSGGFGVRVWLPLLPDQPSQAAR